VTEIRQAFGIADNNITAILRHELDALRWTPDTPVFFTEFERITLGLDITDHGTKIALVNTKLPHSMKEKLAEMALAFENFETMRERLITMWALNPNRQAKGVLAKKKKKKDKTSQAPPKN
jgi:hypothetical protein